MSGLLLLIPPCRRRCSPCMHLKAGAGGFRREVQPRRQHWFLNEKSGFPSRTPAFCSVSRGQRRIGEKEYRAPSVTPGVALRVRTQGPHVNSQHILHRRYEGAIRLGRNDPALFAVRLDNVFFSTRPIVLSLARSTILSSTTSSSNSRKLQRAKPSGGWEHARAISLASFSPSKIRATGGLSRTLRLSTASNPFSTSCFRTQ